MYYLNIVFISTDMIAHELRSSLGWCAFGIVGLFMLEGKLRIKYHGFTSYEVVGAKNKRASKGKARLPLQMTAQLDSRQSHFGGPPLSDLGSR